MSTKPVAVTSPSTPGQFFCSKSGKKVRQARTQNASTGIPNYVCEPCVCGESAGNQRAYLLADGAIRFSNEEAAARAVVNALSKSFDEVPDLPESLGAEVCAALGIDKDLPSREPVGE